MIYLTGLLGFLIGVFVAAFISGAFTYESQQKAAKRRHTIPQDK